MWPSQSLDDVKSSVSMGWSGVWCPEGQGQDEDRHPPVVFYLGVYKWSLVISISLHLTTSQGKYLFNTNFGRLWLLRLQGLVIGLLQIHILSSSPPLVVFPPFTPHQMVIASIESQYKPWEERELMMTEISHYTGRCQLPLCHPAKT